MAESKHARGARPSGLVLGISFLAMAAASAWYLRIEPEREGVPAGVQELIAQHRFENGTPLKTTYTGIAAVDGLLSVIVGAFYPGAVGWNAGVRLLQVHFLLNFFAVWCAWAVEACRRRNAWRAISFVSIFALLYQTIGGAVILPLFYLAYLHTSSSDNYFTSGREVPLSYAIALLPAGILGYIVPTIAMYVPGLDTTMRQNVVAFWQFSPIVANLLVVAFASATPASVASKEKAADVPHIKGLFFISGIVAAITHVLVVAWCASSFDPNQSLAFVFLPNRATWKEEFALGIHYIFQIDWWGCWISTLVWVWICIWDVARLQRGTVGAGELVKAGLVVLSLAVVAGPGTVVSIIGYWREEKLVLLESGAASIPSKARKSKAA